MNSNSIKSGKYVLYWMQSSQRTEFNHALEYAIEQSNRLNQPLAVVFCLLDNFPDANVSHYRFMLQGLLEVKESLKKRGIPFVIYRDIPTKIVSNLGEDASIVVVDRDYLRPQKEWRLKLAVSLECPLDQVESNVVVPIETVSQKEQYSAGTIRPRINRLIEDYLIPVRKRRLKNRFDEFEQGGIDFTDIESVLKDLRFKNRTSQQIQLEGGTSSARRLLARFISSDLDVFDTQRNDPAHDRLSKMSPYLHFGQVSPLEIVLEIMKSQSHGSEAYIEELVVRRELSMNFVHFNSDYDNIECLPNWAKETLDIHALDPREYNYSFREFEQAKTHDPYWNAAQLEMRTWGKMHGYMRMYWGKKILEWSESPEDAYNTCITLNNRYELDGRDANGYTGVAWCFGKHDRAWKEREIYGKVRYMNANGLKRKFDIEKYVQRVQ
jgi:deoxyribodipyrimidine photo-lyase